MPFPFTVYGPDLAASVGARHTSCSAEHEMRLAIDWRLRRHSVYLPVPQLSMLCLPNLLASCPVAAVPTRNTAMPMNDRVISQPRFPDASRNGCTSRQARDARAFPGFCHLLPGSCLTISFLRCLHARWHHEHIEHERSPIGLGSPRGKPCGYTRSGFWPWHLRPCKRWPRISAAMTLELADYVQMPITGELDGQNTRGLLARVNFLRDEPGGRRFFVNDLNGPLYILDKQTKAFTTYLDFNGAGGRPGLFPKFTFERNFAIGLTNFLFDPDYSRNGIFYTIHMEDPAVDAPRRRDRRGRRPRSRRATRRRRRSRRRRWTGRSIGKPC